jgi:formate hydrogenlyase subunit 6/NADH:ubiquinone oxidoreductase subunit I
VLRILQIIAENLGHRPVSVALPEHVPTPAGFRGRVTLDPTRCIGCGMCAYVCVSNAITGAAEGDAYAWTYDPGRCAFCARCVERCPGGALSNDDQPAPSYARPGELAVRTLVTFPPCPDCGTPTRPAPEELARRAFAEVTDETRALLLRCERCRRKIMQRKLVPGLVVEEKTR